MAASNVPFRPSPLSFGSPRSSPFRRPSSSNSAPSVMRQGTPGSSPGRYTPVQSPSKLNQSYTYKDDEAVFEASDSIPEPKFDREVPPSPTKGANPPSTLPRASGARSSGTTLAAANNASSTLSAVQLREIREAFQALDRNNNGTVNRDDVADVLVNLGQDSSASATSRFFPPGSDQTITFPTFLNTLSAMMSRLSSSQEITNALAAFDDDDSGEIDVEELRGALLHTPPEAGGEPLTEIEVNEVLSGFTGRRAFGGKPSKPNGIGGGSRRGEVFRYQDFIGNVFGAESGGANGRPAVNAVKR